MSRVGQAPISIPSGVTVEKTGNYLVAIGSKGTLKVEMVPEIKVETKNDQIIVERKNDQKRVKSLHGTMRKLIANMLDGVNKGWSKDLELVGVGFRAQGGGNKLALNVGFSHPVEVEAPEGISFEITDNTKIKVSGIDKQLVGQVAATVRKIRSPDVYKGKGIRYVGEYIRRKVGKSAKVGVGVLGK